MDSQDRGTGSGGATTKFHIIQPLRDLESNWGVDLARNLEDYLMNICSGDNNAHNEDAHLSVNFAEAALLLQGSVQVYSRKVEYLYSLVLHALEFISQSRSQDHADSTSVQPETSSSRAVHDEEDQFWFSDDIPVDGKNCLDNTRKDTVFDLFVKPPANLVVLEGDCLDSSGDAGELESYLLATNNLYRDFILLDPYDAIAVDEFLKGKNSGDSRNSGHQGSSIILKAHKSFLSPGRQSGGTSRKLGQDNFFPTPPLGGDKEVLGNVFGAGPSNISPDLGNHGFDSYDTYSHHGDFDDSDGDDDDPWKPLNPHETGTLKVKPFRKVKVAKRTGAIKRVTIASQFPLAKLHGTVSSELTEIWEMRLHARERQESRPPSTYEKLWVSLVHGNVNYDTFYPPEGGDEENKYDGGINDCDQPDYDIPDLTFMDEQDNFQPDKHDDIAEHHMDHANTSEDPDSQASLEDLCRSHLDALLASMAESEKQTEMAARVSTWKQRIELDLEEEDSHPPFDIHKYGEAVLNKLSLDEGERVVSFTDVVKGQEKQDIARTFSALLQLVNDRKVSLDRGTLVDESYCYTAVNPFNVLRLDHDKGPKKMQFHVSKKRQKSPITRGYKIGHTRSSHRSPSSGSASPLILSQPSCKLSAKMNGLASTPDGKRRRRSRLVESVDFNSPT